MKIISKTKSHITIKFTHNELDRFSICAYEWANNECASSNSKEGRKDYLTVNKIIEKLKEVL